MADTMKGLVKMEAAPSSFTFKEDLPIPVPADDEVLLKVRVAALCGTDIHILDWDAWSQKRVKPPFIMGHEMCGEIVAVGKNVTDRKIGQRVSCETHVACGDCYFCKNGMPHLCNDIILFGCTTNGAFAEYTTIKSHSTYVLSDDLPDEAGCLFEPMGAAVHGVETADVEGKVILVSGCGPLGTVAVAGAKTFGAKMVIACDLIDARLENAKIMGADYVFNSGKIDLVEEVKKLTDGIGADAAIDITGVESAINTDLKCLRAQGKMVCVGLPTKPITIHDMTDDLLYREICLTGVSGRLIWQTWDDFAKIMSGPYFELDNVIGGRFILEDYDKALEEIKKGTPGKMLFYPDASLMK